ncbi:uncharacterized protein LOC123382746 [Felis catus]|uniref:uncharacterized protein LOC123382746 n=1 Tax=Felis catus TaxID=9685 RepID=UPI001D19CDBB|nr:uncharacterized protein LOC123382746 [Felis catus]
MQHSFTDAASSRFFDRTRTPPTPTRESRTHGLPLSAPPWLQSVTQRARSLVSSTGCRPVEAQTEGLRPPARRGLGFAEKKLEGKPFRERDKGVSSIEVRRELLSGQSSRLSSQPPFPPASPRGLSSEDQSLFAARPWRGGEEGAGDRAECSCRGRRLFSSSGVGSRVRATAEETSKGKTCAESLQMLGAFVARSCPSPAPAARLLLLLLRLFVPGLREPQLPAAAAAAAASASAAPLWVWGLLGLSRASAPAPRTDA